MASLTRLGLSGIPRPETREQIIYDLLSVSLEVNTELSAPAIGAASAVIDLFAESIEAGSELGVPSLGHIYNLSAQSIEAVSEVSAPYLKGEATLSSQDLLDIADAVYDKFVSEGFNPVHCSEVWQLMGLDSSNPTTTTQTSADTGTIHQDITGDGVNTSTITRTS